MRCPDCQAELPEGTEVCRYCLALLPPAAPRVAAPSPWPPPAAARQVAQSEVQTRMIELDLQQDKGTQIVEVSLPAVVRRKVRQAEEGGSSPAGGTADHWRLEVEESEVSHGVDEALRLLRLFYARLHRFDRWGVKAFIATFIAAFLPWIHIRGEGLKAGVETLGAVSAAGAAAALICMYLRTFHRRSAASLVLLQLLLAALITAAPIYRFLSFGGEDLQLSFGIFLTALGGALAVVLSLLRLALIGA